MLRSFHLLQKLTVLVVFGLCLAVTGAQAKPALSELTIHTSSGPVPFNVELANTPSQRAKGLMFRQNLPARQGMLFDFEREHEILMWMKNTPIPLDMIFMNGAGHIVSIVENTKPFSLDIIESGKKACAVLEVNAGSAAKFGIRVGNRVEHPLFELKKKRRANPGK